MTHPRLSLALQGAEALPAEGRILVLGPTAATDLGDLPQDRSVIVQGFRPDYEAFAARGWTVEPELTPGDYSAAVIFLPRARAAARALVAEAARQVVSGGPVWIDGQKTDGIDTMAKDVRARTAISAPIAKAHGKIFRFDATGQFDDWRSADIVPAPGFITRPGVFSAEKPDQGSMLLAAALPDKLPGRIADLGAGWGWLAAEILAREGVAELHLIEADRAALDCARRNITDPRARFHWEDATRFRPEGPIDAVVMNPPFHTGRAAEPALGAAFIAAAAAMLTPGGRLWMVANRHLPYEAVLAKYFRDTEEIGGDGGFKLLYAARPQAAARPRR